MNVMVVEDNRTCLLVIKSMCEKLGHRVVEATDGVDGLDKYHRDRSQIIISDLVMPKMDGISFCKKLRSQEKEFDPFFFLMTGKVTSNANHDEALIAGVDDFLLKPPSFHLLQEALQKAQRATHPSARLRAA